MSNNKDYPAFPIPVTNDTSGIYTSYDANGGDTMGGLTKREYLAAKAMQALIAAGATGVGNIAAESVWYADALLAELEK